MEKPKKKTQVSEFYDYHEIIEYIEDKYQIDTRDYLGKFVNRGKSKNDVEYLDFWHWFIENQEIHNGCYAYFPDDWNTDDEEYSPWWVKEIMTLITKEFFPNKGEDMKVWVSW